MKIYWTALNGAPYSILFHVDFSILPESESHEEKTSRPAVLSSSGNLAKVIQSAS